MLGRLEPFYLEYGLTENVDEDAKRQAHAILSKAVEVMSTSRDQKAISDSIPGIGIIYSANAEQTRSIKNRYSSGEFSSGVTGGNQANVIANVDLLLEEEKYKSLQRKFHVIPITTCQQAGGYGLVSDSELREDIARLAVYLNRGWHILGWQNQDANDNQPLSFAIGGCISKVLTSQQNQFIQDSLRCFANGSEKRKSIFSAIDDLNQKSDKLKQDLVSMQHRHLCLDWIFGIKNTSGQKNKIAAERKKALTQLNKELLEIKKECDKIQILKYSEERAYLIRDKITLLAAACKMGIFKDHCNNSIFFGAFGRTQAVKTINQKLEICRQELYCEYKKPTA